MKIDKLRVKFRETKQNLFHSFVRSKNTENGRLPRISLKNIDKSKSKSKMKFTESNDHQIVATGINLKSML